jgi:tyrosyl-tRNA synthetase
MAYRNIVDMICEYRLAKSKSEARRLVKQGAVRLNGQIVNNVDYVYDDHSKFDIDLRVGKDRYFSWRAVPFREQT